MDGDREKTLVEAVTYKGFKTTASYAHCSLLKLRVIDSYALTAARYALNPLRTS